MEEQEEENQRLQKKKEEDGQKDEGDFSDMVSLYRDQIKSQMKPSDESQVFLSSDSKNQVELVEKEASSAKIFSVSSKEDEDISFEITPKDKTSKIKSLSVKESTLVQQGSSQKLQVTLDLIIDQANPQDQVLA